MLDILWNELNTGFPDQAQLVRVVVRLLGAMLMGAIVGFEREQAGKEAGLRTHILVALGSALFVLAASGSGMSPDAVARVIQGLAAGIGFLGAGAILKISASKEIHGLTTAAGIWMTAAIGVAAGLGGLGLALLGTLLTWLVLQAIGSLEQKVPKRPYASKEDDI